jgi:excisionase family DNA binding protein
MLAVVGSLVGSKVEVIMKTTNCIAQLEMNYAAPALEAHDGETFQENKVGKAGSNARMKLATVREEKIASTLPDGDQFLLLPEVAGSLRVSVKTVRRLIDEGKIKTHKIRGRILVRRTELMAYINAAAR